MAYRLELEPEDLRGGDGAVAARRWGMIVVLALMVMAGSAAAFWAAWRAIGHHGAPGAVPVLHADERPVKVPPANPGGMEVPDQDMYILNRDKPVDSRVEQLLPPPETPLPRPTPPQPVVTDSPPATPAPVAAPAVQVTPEPATAPPAAAEPAPPPASAPAAAAAQSPPVAVAAPPPAAVAPPTPAVMPTHVAPPSPPKAVSGSGYRLQLGAVRTAEAAQQEWTRLKREQPELLGSLSAEARRVDLRERGVYYRIVAGPIGDAAAAEHACDELKRHKVGCLLVKP
jgi:hypothetical protein